MVRSKRVKPVQPRRGEKSRRNWIWVSICAVLLAVWPVTHGLPRVFAATEASTSPYESAVPFRVGEILNYRVEWAAFSNAAAVRLSVPERRNLYGWQTWHFRATIHTLGSVRSLFEMDDQFDSYSDRSNFESRQFEEHLNEMGRQKEDVMHLTATGEGAKGPGPMVVVLPGTLDPLAALYDLRTIDWQRTPEFRAPVYDGKDMYEMRAHRDETDEALTVAAGQFSTSRISIQLFQYEKEVAGMHVEIWLANNGARTPVLMRADLPLGNVRAELISATNSTTPSNAKPGAPD
ncbi:MAG: DUF3108 domain-containing protein [Candidatus Acidiferrales bacterium]